MDRAELLLRLTEVDAGDPGLRASEHLDDALPPLTLRGRLIPLENGPQSGLHGVLLVSRFLRAPQLLQDSDRPGVTIDRDPLPTDEAPGHIAGSHDCRNAVLPSDNRAMCEHATYVRDQPQRLGK